MNNINMIITIALLDNEDLIIQRNIIKYLIGELQEPLQLPYNHFIQGRGVREKNKNYFEEIIPSYISLFKEHFRMTPTAIDVCKTILYAIYSQFFKLKL